MDDADVGELLVRYRQACADAGVSPLPDDEARQRLQEVWAALAGLVDAPPGRRLPH